MTTIDHPPAIGAVLLKLQISDRSDATTLTFESHTDGVAVRVVRYDDEVVALAAPFCGIHPTLAAALAGHLSEERARLEPHRNDDDEEERECVVVTHWDRGADALQALLVAAGVTPVYVTLDRTTTYFDGTELGAPPPDLRAADLHIVWRFCCGVETGGPWTREIRELVGTWRDHFFYVDDGDTDDPWPVHAGRFDDVIEGITAALEFSHRTEWDRLDLWQSSEEGLVEAYESRQSHQWDDIVERLRNFRIRVHADAKGVAHASARCLRALQHQPVQLDAHRIRDLFDDAEIECCRSCLAGVTDFLRIVRDLDDDDSFDETYDGDDEGEDDEWQTVLHLRAGHDPTMIEQLVSTMFNGWHEVDRVRRPIMLWVEVPPRALTLVERTTELTAALEQPFSFVIDPLFEQDPDIGPNGLPRRLLGGFTTQPTAPARWVGGHRS